IHHTNCGMIGLRDEAVTNVLADRLQHPVAPHAYGGFDDLAQSVRDDIATIRADDRIPESIPISGFIYDVETGRLIPVD
ncbi:MAG TPA: carbonic anhydrase, partial [Nitrolancea sp.]|nr:carbonic anhydrase [Nitrolancea sp.]